MNFPHFFFVYLPAYSALSFVWLLLLFFLCSCCFLLCCIICQQRTRSSSRSTSLYLELFVWTVHWSLVGDLLLCVSSCNDATLIDSVAVDRRPSQMQLGRPDKWKVWRSPYSMCRLRRKVCKKRSLKLHKVAWLKEHHLSICRDTTLFASSIDHNARHTSSPLRN